MISLIHPSRGRAKQAREAYNRWLERSQGDFEYILSIDTSDPTQAQYFKAFEGVQATILLNPNRSIVDAVNVAVRQSQGEYIVVMSDDFDCPENWDVKIMVELHDPTAFGLLHVDDTIQKDVVTIPILTRALFDRLGHVYHNSYFSMFADNDLTESAKRLNAYKQAFHLVFPHNHYVNGKAKMDATYERENSKKAWDQGQRAFKIRQKQNFGIR